MKTNLELAAPALLEALKEIVKSAKVMTIATEGDVFFCRRSLWDKILAAIALAEAPEIDPVSGLPFNRD